MRSDIVGVIPAYQCEGQVADVVAGARRFLARVVVVSDGSTDATVERARAAGGEVHPLPENHGKGFALRRGLEIAFASTAAGSTSSPTDEGPAAVVLLDADGQHDPDDLPLFFAEWDRAHPDLVIGARLGDPGRIPGARYWANYIGSRILTWMTGYELEDSQSGYRLLSAELVRKLRLVSDGYAIETEMLIKAAVVRARIAHVRVRTIYDAAPSYFRPIRDTFRISCAAIYFKVFADE